MKITIKFKLNPSIEQIKLLNKTLSISLDALNYISKIAWKEKCFNRVALHHLVYYKVKKKFKFNSQICCDLKDKVAFSYKTDVEKQHFFKNFILPLLFKRTITFKENNIVSISLVNGREKIPIIMGSYQKKEFIKAVKFHYSELVKRKNKFYINIVIEIPDNPMKPTKDFIGVDLGIGNIATCSNGSTFTGKQVQIVRDRYNGLRARLQSKGTPSAKRHLKKLSGKEQKFMRDINHVVSKRIVQLANQLDSTIALENLKGIRRTKKKGKTINGILNRWAFYQLRQFISYKAQREGIPVILINPAFTSQICSSCGSLGIRESQGFYCPNCSFSADADFNASLNIKRAAINQPIVRAIA